MLSHEQAQELHQCIGQGIARDGAYLEALDRALELAAVIVSDTDPDNAEPDTTINVYFTGDEDGPDLFGVVYDDEDGVMETARENEECAWRVPVQPNLDKAELIYEHKDEEDSDD